MKEIFTDHRQEILEKEENSSLHLFLGSTYILHCLILHTYYALVNQLYLPSKEILLSVCIRASILGNFTRQYLPV